MSYESLIRRMEAEGMNRQDAQAQVDAEAIGRAVDNPECVCLQCGMKGHLLCNREPKVGA